VLQLLAISQTRDRSVTILPEACDEGTTSTPSKPHDNLCIAAVSLVAFIVFHYKISLESILARNYHLAQSRVGAPNLRATSITIRNTWRGVYRVNDSEGGRSGRWTTLNRYSALYSVGYPRWRRLQQQSSRSLPRRSAPSRLEYRQTASTPRLPPHHLLCPLADSPTAASLRILLQAMVLGIAQVYGPQAGSDERLLHSY
jgi:hypothetical protein